MPDVRRKLRRPGARARFVEDQIDLALLAAEADRRGLTQDREVQRVLAQILARRLLESSAPPPATEAELRAAFEAHRADFDRPAERRVSAIVLSPRRWGGAAKARTRAVELRAEAQAHRAEPEHFRRLVDQYSDDAKSKLRGGATPYFTHDDETVAAPVREAAFTVLAEIGDVTVVESKQGPQVVRLIGRRGVSSASFEAVRARVLRLVDKQRRAAAEAALLEELRRRATIELHDKAMRRIRVE